jgi:hypothetical protein
LYASRKRSSHATDSASRWLVGSSSSSRSGEERSRRASATRRGHVAITVGEPQRVHRPVEGRVEVPGVGAVDLVLHRRLLGEQRVEVRVRLCELGRDRVEAVEQVAELADAVLDVLPDVARRVELGLLGEHAHRGTGCELGDAARRLLEPGHDPQQRRLAGPVRAEHADLRAGEEAERDVRQHLPVGAVELVGPVHRVHVVAQDPAR